MLFKLSSVFFLFIYLINYIFPSLHSDSIDKHLSFCKLPLNGHGIQLICLPNKVSYNITSNVQAKVQNTELKGFQSTCPNAYDFKGIRHQTAHMCTASAQKNICSFIMNNYVISSEGMIMECNSGNYIDFSHPSISGEAPYYYYPIHKLFYEYYTETKTRFNKRLCMNIEKKYNHKHQRSRNNTYQTYDIVVPTRMRWDDCFNHLSFQSVPLIGIIYEFHSDIWNKINWHTSLFTAAILRLLKVPKSRIIIDDTIFAKTILLPWVPSWCPPQLASLNGISRNILHIITKNLLEKYSDSNQEEISSFSNNDEKKYIVYLIRSIKRPRPVVNQNQILTILKKYLLPQYEIIILSPTSEYSTIKELHASWVKHARIISKAKVILGPHGNYYDTFNIIILCFNFFKFRRII